VLLDRGYWLTAILPQPIFRRLCARLRAVLASGPVEIVGGSRDHRDNAENYDQWLAWDYDRHQLGRQGSAKLARGDTPLGVGAADIGDDEWGDQAALLASLTVVAPVVERLVPHFYEQLFTANPRLRALFPASMHDQHERLLAALLALVDAGADATRKRTLVARLEQLGRDHRKFGARPPHYATVGAALIATLRHFAGPAWTPAVEAAWLARYTLAARIMTAAADIDESPPFWYATVVGHERRGDDVAVLHLRPRHPYRYRAGQHATIASPRLPRVWRPYAMANAPRPDLLLEFHVRAQGSGGLSDILVTGTCEGDALRLGAPQGSAALDPSSERGVLLVAGGTGWAPAKALLDAVTRGRPPRRTHVVYATRYPGDAYDDGVLHQLDRHHPWLTIKITNGSDQPIGGVPPSDVDPGELDVYLAGPPDLIHVSERRLTAAGVPDARIHRDSWAGA
jgi:NAD(P)H-flavin reductase/hemoglobin-like flavoprotein